MSIYASLAVYGLTWKSSGVCLVQKVFVESRGLATSMPKAGVRFLLDIAVLSILN